MSTAVEYGEKSALPVKIFLNKEGIL